MWIIPKQLHTSASALDTKALGLDSEEFSQICEKSLTWRGKDSLSRTWLQRWKRENWMQHLCSRTLRPSLTESFVDAWTSSVVASRANHSVLLESVTALKIRDTSSHTSPTESESANLELFSSKTLKESSQPRQQTESQFSSMSSESWKAWVTEQRQEYSQRLKSARLIRESESSSLAWPTSRTSDAEGGRIETEMTEKGFKSKRHRSNQTFGAKLRDAVETYEKKNWATPQTFDSNNIVRTPEKLAQTRAEKNAGCMNLREQVHYPEMDHSRKAAKNWPTVTVGEEKYRIKGNSQASKCLSAMAARGELGHPDQANHSTTGKSQGSQGKLNPDWVEQLMGLPSGVDRLRLLGNGVVPATAAKAFLTLIQRLND